MLKQAYAADVELWVESGKLKYRAPAGALTEEMKQGIIQHKDRLIFRLEQIDAAKLEHWMIFEFGEMYSKRLNQTSEMCIFLNDNDTFTVWRGGWKSGEAKPSWQKTMVENVPFQEAFDQANSYMNWSKKKVKGGSRQW